MASILDKYGIKEVADITFYELDKNGKPAYPVLYIDTAKTSTIEQTAEETTAKGGKGNPSLISWDYNKDINVTLEDALFTAKSLAIMFGDGKVKKLDSAADAIMRTEIIAPKNIPDAGVAVTAFIESNTYGYEANFKANNGKEYPKQNPKFYDEDGKSISIITKNNARIFCSYDLVITSGTIVEISANTFPGTYYVTGDTFARSEANGEDEFFQFILPKAKVLSENTITLEAEGDPTVFSMKLHVLRPADGVMMKLVKYDLANGVDSTNTSDLVHNHQLNAPADVDVNQKVTYKPVTEDDKKDDAKLAGLDSDNKWIKNSGLEEKQA